MVAKLLGCAESEVDLTREFTEYGISSLDGLALLGDLEDLVGRRLPDSLLWDYPDLERLTRHLQQQIPAPSLGDLR
jgi:acyl carrier protein